MLKVTIKDVAQSAQVAISTVSLVLNGKGKVSKETRCKVLAAMRQLNYRPSRVAQGLAGKLTGNIGFILSEDHFTRGEPFYSLIFLGSEFEARNHNIYVLLTVVKQTFDRKNDIPRFLLDRIVDGMIVAGRVPFALIEYLQTTGYPLVFIDFLPLKGPAQAILIDNVEGARQAVAHLLTIGRKQIAFLAGDIQHPSIAGRYEGYIKALTENALPLNPQLVVTSLPDTTFQYGYAATLELLNRRVKFDGIFATNDAMALGCLRCLEESQLRVPQDVAVVGFDDVGAASESNPPLTTIRINKEEMGILALRMLLGLIQSQAVPNTKIIVPTNLIVRNST